MKICPNCRAEVEDHFDLCWKCDYSFSEGNIVQIKDERECEIECLRCKSPMFYEGNYDFRMGFLPEASKNFDVYTCPQCGKAEFFIPERKLRNREKRHEK